MRSYDSCSMLSLHDIRRSWLVRLLRTPGSHRDDATPQPRRLAAGHNVLDKLDKCEADAHGLSRPGTTGDGSGDGARYRQMGAKRCSAATLTVAGLAMREKAASCPIRIRPISTTLHSHPTLRILIGNICNGNFCDSTPSGPCDKASAMERAPPPKT